MLDISRTIFWIGIGAILLFLIFVSAYFLFSDYKQGQKQVQEDSFHSPWNIADCGWTYALVHEVTAEKILVEAGYKGSQCVIYDTKEKMYLEPYTWVDPRPEHDRVIPLVEPLGECLWVHPSIAMGSVSPGDVLCLEHDRIVLCDQTKDVFWKRASLPKGY